MSEIITDAVEVAESTGLSPKKKLVIAASVVLVSASLALVALRARSKKKSEIVVEVVEDSTPNA
jgi:hypothetical protein